MRDGPLTVLLAIMLLVGRVVGLLVEPPGQ
jgi:hypothetical protein